MNKVIFLLIIALLGCTSKSGNKDNPHSVSDSLHRKEEKDYKPKSLEYAQAEIDLTDTSQFYVVGKECAITILPDSVWIKEQQKQMSVKAWNEFVTDKQYYLSHAIDTLLEIQIAVHNNFNQKRYIKFIKADNTTIILDRTKLGEHWGLILFNGNNTPVLWSSTTIAASIHGVYGR